MKALARTRLVVFRPYRHRAEQCTVGILAVLPDGTAQAFPGAQLRKVRALDPSMSIEHLREGLNAIAQEVTKYPEAIKLHEEGIGAISLSKEEGFVTFDDADRSSLEAAIQWSLAVAVEPQKATKQRERASISRLFVEVKSAFSVYGWMAEPGDTLEAHKIIPRFNLSEAEGLMVDFALQNGSLNCIQTIDYRNTHEHKRVEASAKLLTLGYASSFGKATKYSIIAGADSELAHQGIRLAERVSDDIFIHESSDDMGRLFNRISEAMGQPPIDFLPMT